MILLLYYFWKKKNKKKTCITGIEKLLRSKILKVMVIIAANLSEIHRDDSELYILSFIISSSDQTNKELTTKCLHISG